MRINNYSQLLRELMPSDPPIDYSRSHNFHFPLREQRPGTPHNENISDSSDDSDSSSDSFDDLPRNRNFIMIQSNLRGPQGLFLQNHNGIHARFDGGFRINDNISMIFNQLVANIQQDEDEDRQQQPASRDTVENLKEIEVERHHFSKNDKTGDLSPPACSI